MITVQDVRSLTDSAVAKAEAEQWLIHLTPQQSAVMRATQTVIDSDIIPTVTPAQAIADAANKLLP